MGGSLQEYYIRRDIAHDARSTTLDIYCCVDLSWHCIQFVSASVHIENKVQWYVWLDRWMLESQQQRVIFHIVFFVLMLLSALFRLTFFAERQLRHRHLCLVVHCACALRSDRFWSSPASTEMQLEIHYFVCCCCCWRRRQKKRLSHVELLYMEFKVLFLLLFFILECRCVVHFNVRLYFRRCSISIAFEK